MRPYARVGVFHIADIGLHGGENTLSLGLGLAPVPYGLGRRVTIGRRVGVVHRHQHAQVVGVVGNALKVQGSVELQVEARGMLDSVTLGIFVGLVRTGSRSEHECVVRIAGVDVEVAEVGVALVRCWRRAGFTGISARRITLVCRRIRSLCGASRN